MFRASERSATAARTRANVGALFSLYRRSYKSALRLMDYFPSGFRVNSMVLSHLAPKVAWTDRGLLYLDRTDSLRLSLTGTYETGESRALARLLDTYSVVLDVGAHIGYHTVHFAHLARGRVFAFEPSVENFRLLKANVQLHNLGNVTLLNKAVGSATGQVLFQHSRFNSGDNRVVAAGGHGTSSVDCVSIDDFLANLDVPSLFVKIDVQGFETAVLSGMRGILGKVPKIGLIFEFWPRGIRTGGGNPDQLLSNLRRAGFSLSTIRGEMGNLVPIDNEEGLFSMANRARPIHDLVTGGWAINLIALREEIRRGMGQEI